MKSEFRLIKQHSLLNEFYSIGMIIYNTDGSIKKLANNRPIGSYLIGDYSSVFINSVAILNAFTKDSIDIKDIPITSKDELKSKAILNKK